MAEPVVVIEGLWKAYGPTLALRDVSLEVPENSFYLLMGPNGSGKSTLLKILAGLLKPSRGRVRVLGLNPWRKRHELFARLGVMFEDHAMPDWASGRAFLEYMARLKKLDRPEEAALEAASLFKADEYWDRPIGSYSSGMRRKLALAHAFLGDPELIMLDDPTVALDKHSRATLSQLIAEGLEAGKTFIVASHVITDFEARATHLAILSQGRVLVEGTVPDVAGRMGMKATVFEVDDVGRAVQVAVGLGYRVRAEGNSLLVEELAKPEELLKALENAGVKARLAGTRADIWGIYMRALSRA